MTGTDPPLEAGEVRRGLLSGRAAALRTVQGWVEGLVFGGRWRLPDPEGAAEPPDPRSESPEERLEREERGEILRFIVQGLGEDCRRLWSWIYRDGLAQSAIAERLGITTGNLRVRVHRCLKRARALHDSYLPRPKGGRRE